MSKSSTLSTHHHVPHYPAPGSYRPWPFVTEVIAARAERFRSEGNHLAAALEWRALADLDDHDVRAAVRWGHHAAKSGQTARAARAFFCAAGAAVRCGDPRRALLLARHALELAPACATREQLEPLAHGCGPEGEALCTVAARLHAEADRVEHAVEINQMLATCDRAGSRANADPISTGRTGEFVRVAEAMIARGRYDADTVLELAKIYLRRGQLREAVEKLELLRRVAPDRLATAELLVQTLVALGRTRSALALLQDVARRHEGAKDDVRALFDRAESLQSGDVDWPRLVRALGERWLAHGVPEVVRPSGTPPPPPVWSLPRRVLIGR